MSIPVATFTFPVATIFGPGCIAELGSRLQQIGSRKPLVVTDPGLLQTRAFDSLVHSLGGSKMLSSTWELFHGVHSNPLEQDIIEAAAAYRAGGCDGVIGFGGGSALDVAKACRLVIKRPDVKLARFNPAEDWSGLARCICVPTTAGSGSEMTRGAMITLAGKSKHLWISSSRLMAKLVLLDPELTIGLPPHLTAVTGLDALTHCIEAFTSPVYQPFCDGLALEAIHLIVGALYKVFKNGTDVDARGRMQVAAAMAGVAAQKELGATHSLAPPLSVLCGLDHGLANAICLPRVMEFNAARKPGLYRRVGLAFGLDVMKATPEEADRKTIEMLKRFSADLGLGGGLRAQGVKEGLVESLAIQAFGDPCHVTNPVPVNYDDLKALYQAAMQG